MRAESYVQQTLYPATVSLTHAHLATAAAEVVHALRTVLRAKPRRLSIVTVVRPNLAVGHLTPVNICKIGHTPHEGHVARARKIVMRASSSSSSRKKSVWEEQGRQ